MKNIFLSVTLSMVLCGIIVAGLLFPTAFAFAYPNEPDGFRDIKWQTAKQAMSGLKVNEGYGSYVQYWRDSENLNFEGMQAAKILYGFTGDYLETVIVQFEPCDAACYSSLKQKLVERHGPGQSVGEKDVFWQGDKTNIKLETYGEGLEVIFSDAERIAKRFSNINDFNSKFETQRDQLLNQYDATTASGKIKEWLAKEGKDVLDSFQVSPKGEQITLHFKGGGDWVFTPSPQNVRQQTTSQNIYSVAEAVTILQNNSKQFRYKDILLRAAVVDGVMGMGCEDFYILTDTKDVGLYHRQYKSDVTPEEKKKIKDIPRIISGPTLAMPKGVSGGNGKETIFRGHFFDNSMKPCTDGWKRFVITGNDER